MESLSKRPADFKKFPESGNLVAIDDQAIKDIWNRSDSPEEIHNPITGTVPVSTDISNSGTVPRSTTVPRSNTVPVSGTASYRPTPEGHFETKPRVRVFRATRVEHGHSSGEHIIYEVLWRNSAGDQLSRQIQIGYDRLATLANVNWKTAKACLRSLESKLAIETIGQADPNQQLGRIYRIYSFTLILERRRTAGLDWVEKGRGVRFLPIPSTSATGTVLVSNTVPQSGTVLETGTETVPETGTGTVPETGTPIYIGSVKEIIKETSSSQNYSLLAKKLSDLGLPVDDDAAQKIVKRCRNADSTATLEEISHFTQLKVQQLAKRKNIENWPGMLISAVPAYFDGEATEVRKYRSDKLIQAREAIEAQAWATEHRREQERILADPEASEGDKRLARKFLSEEGN
jgi:hypothetical protein